MLFRSVENPLHTILLTSTAQSADKSTTLVNLAVTFAQSGNKTILVDSDLRKPTQHEIWGIPNDRGLTTMMIEDGAMSSPPLVDTGVAGLQVLPSGPLPPNPASAVVGCWDT